MSIVDDDLLDPFLREIDGAELLPVLVGASVQPGAEVRARTLEVATRPGRHARFASAVSELLDLTVTDAMGLLDQVDDPGAWSAGLGTGMTLLHVVGGPGVKGAITGFVRILAGESFPAHEHLGAEEVLILQGSCLDSHGNVVCRPGDRVRMDAGSVHELRVRPGPDLLYLAKVFRGIRVGGEELLADDPRV